MTLFAVSYAALMGFIFQTYTVGPYTPPAPFRFLGYVYLVASVVGIVSGLLLIAKKLLRVSIIGNVFVLACGFLSGPIVTYLAFASFGAGGDWEISGYFVALPIIIFSAVSLVLTIIGHQRAYVLK